ncbi:hypothetical protein CYPRO_1932 [Cyclonatronum proteinivorum]|uniref:Uncharacterized protein n=1 Tax=Cyclonatronum proteinivorum TaxID=1457365 RepID=A0A345UL30_9BACT|nr:hypothetical protein CYPRO_1932 [Cyclonatronum proteinivorum]
MPVAGLHNRMHTCNSGLPKPAITSRRVPLGRSLIMLREVSCRLCSPVPQHFRDDGLVGLACDIFVLQRCRSGRDARSCVSTMFRNQKRKTCTLEQRDMPKPALKPQQTDLPWQAIDDSCERSPSFIYARQAVPVTGPSRTDCSAAGELPGKSANGDLKVDAIGVNLI